MVGFEGEGRLLVFSGTSASHPTLCSSSSDNISGAWDSNFVYFHNLSSQHEVAHAPVLFNGGGQMDAGSVVILGGVRNTWYSSHNPFVDSSFVFVLSCTDMGATRVFLKNRFIFIPPEVYRPGSCMVQATCLNPSASLGSGVTSGEQEELGVFFSWCSCVGQVNAPEYNSCFSCSPIVVDGGGEEIPHYMLESWATGKDVDLHIFTSRILFCSLFSSPILPPPDGGLL